MMKKKPSKTRRDKIKLAIVGSRGITDFEILRKHAHHSLRFVGIHLSDIKEIVSGGARGADELSVDLALKYQIPHKAFIAEWERPDGSKNLAAGFERNTLIANECDAALVLWDGYSNGTADTISKIAAQNKPYILLIVEFSDPPYKTVAERKKGKKKPIETVREIYFNSMPLWDALADELLNASVDASLKQIKEDQNEKKRKAALNRRSGNNKTRRK